MKNLEKLLKLYNKQFIKLGTEADFSFQFIYPIYQKIGDYLYPINIKSWDNYLYIKAEESVEIVKEWFDYFDEKDKEEYKNRFKL